MKKIIMILMVMVVTLTSETIYAKSSVYEETQVLSNLTVSGENKYNCESLLGNPDIVNSPAYYLQIVFDVMKYAGVVLCVVLTMVDFVKAVVINQDKDAYKGLSKTAFTRFCYAVALFFIPTLIMAILKVVGIIDTCGIS